MTTKEFKQIVKEAAREVFQEELKDILLEALRSPKPIVTENKQWVGPDPTKHNTATPSYAPPATISIAPEVRQNMRESYMNILNETAISFNTQNVPFNPVSADPINGDLPEGDLPMNYIMNLMNNK